MAFQYPPPPAPSTRDILEQKLGPASDFIISHHNIADLRQWAILLGENPVDISVMTRAALANLYHEKGPGGSSDARPSQVQLDAADLISRVVQAIGEGVTSMTALRSIIREEIPTVDMLQTLAQQVYDALPPRRLDVTTNAGTVQLSGPMHYRTADVIRVAALGHHIMLVGPAGCGKTTIGEHVARALQFPFYITSTVMDTHELLGFVDGHGNYKLTAFRQAYETGGVWVADEIDAWDAAALLTANSALANGFITFPDSPVAVRRHPNFRMIATANTFGHGADRIYIGRNELDAASLDRFATITVDYDTNLEQMLCGGNPSWLHRVWKVRKAVEDKRIRHVVSTRAIIFGSQALQVGIPQVEVESMYLFKGMNESDREKVG